MEATYVRASVISKDELALALSGMDESEKKRVGIAGSTVADLVILLGDVARASKLLQELGLRGGYYLREYKGRTYVILKGHAGLRAHLKGTRYLAKSPTVVRLGIGPIAFRNALRFNLVLAFTLYTASSIIDYLAGDNTTLEQLAGDLLYNGASTALSVVIGGLATAAVGTYVTMALPAIGAGLVAGFVVGHLMSSLNEEKQITALLAKSLLATAEAFSKGFIDTRREVIDAFKRTKPEDIDPGSPLDEEVHPDDSDFEGGGGLSERDEEPHWDYEGWFGFDFSEWDGRNDAEGYDQEREASPGPENGGDVDIDGDVWEFTLIDANSGEAMGPTEAYEVGEESVIKGDRPKDDDDDVPVGSSD